MNRLKIYRRCLIAALLLAVMTLGIYGFYYMSNPVPDEIRISEEETQTLDLGLKEVSVRVVKREEVIAIGDGVCDVTMIQLAGLGIAMGHSQDSVKICADYVTASNEEDGVAIAVEKAIIAEVRAAEIPLDQLNAQARHALMGNLGIQYTYAAEDRVEATMPVDHRTRQPFGLLHGGASLALAEPVAGLGSMIVCPPG